MSCRVSGFVHPTGGKCDTLQTLKLQLIDIPRIHMRPIRPTLVLRSDRIKTPTGTMLILADEDGCLRSVDWEDHADRMERLLARHYGDRVVRTAGRTPNVRTAIEAYFDGDFEALDGLDVATNGTPFQREVWAALRTIPAGETLSYSGLAQRIGRPSAVRAVGLANGSNPIGVVVPCHRVIGADGTLTGYGGGIERKRWLLTHESTPFRD